VLRLAFRLHRHVLFGSINQECPAALGSSMVNRHDTGNDFQFHGVVIGYALPLYALTSLEKTLTYLDTDRIGH